MEKNELETLRYELGRRDKAIRDRNRQLAQLKLGVEEARELFDGYMLQTALKYGYKAEFGDESYEHCISIPKVELDKLDGLVLRLVGQDEDGDNVFAVVEKEQEEEK